MRKWRIEYSKEYQPSPLSFWVHRNLDNDLWSLASKFDPSLPNAIPLKGFPVLLVDALGIELRFSSVEEVEHFLDVISAKNMPTPMQLTKKRNVNYGPNGHWLSRLPSKLKPWGKREKIIPIIKEGLGHLKTIYGR
jgi:hypothetical protein